MFDLRANSSILGMEFLHPAQVLQSLFLAAEREIVVESQVRLKMFWVRKELHLDCFEKYCVFSEIWEVRRRVTREISCRTI